MLPDRDLQLLTAYVDGELSSRQHKLVVRLLEKSPAAGQILQQLQEHAQKIRQLPQKKLESAFAAQVIDAVKHPSVNQPAGRPVVARRRWPTWSRYAVAASVLAVLAGGLTWLVNRQPNGPGPNHIAKNGAPRVPQAPHVDHSALVASVVEGVVGEFGRPLPPERPGTKLAFEDLAKTQWHEHLVDGMAKQQAVHLDVAVINQRQAVQRLETVLANKGIKVVVDPLANIKLGDQQARTDFVIYAENIRPDELAAMLYELGTDERARTSIEALTVSNVTDDDHKSLSNLLGIGSQELAQPSAKPLPLETFIPKQENKRGGGDSEPVRASATGAPRIAMVLANEGRRGALSSEIQYFLNQRRQLQPGALRVIVVVHQG